MLLFYQYNLETPTSMTYNCDLLVLGPVFAILRTPRPVCVRFGFNSSLKALPHIDCPPGKIAIIHNPGFKTC